MSDDRIVVSFSEIDTFRDCPLKWKLAYIDRWSKEPEEGSALHRGSAWHEVMAIHYRTLRETAGYDWSDDARLKLAWTRISESGAFGDDEGQTEQQNLLQWMYLGYVELYGVDAGWEILAVEHKAEVPLLTSKEVAEHADLATRAKPESVDVIRPVRFWVKIIIDLVYRDRLTGKIWIVDHKTFGDPLRIGDLELNDQFGIYTAGLRAMGKKVLGACHNGARTKKLKRVMTMDERFARKLLSRTDVELDNLIIDFRNAARMAYDVMKPAGLLYSAPNPRQCGWKCDYERAHLAARKGVPIEQSLRDYGFQQIKERH
jgi:hypothetical protein